MKLKHTLFSTTLVVSAVSAAAFSGGFQLNEHSSRGVGMAGAFVARPFDPSAVFINPGGLPLIKDVRLYGGGVLILPTSSFVGRYPENPVPHTNMEKNAFFPPHVYAAYGNGTWGFGIGVFTMFGLGTEWPDKWAGRVLSGTVDLKTFFINPTVAYKPAEWISIGAGVSYVPSVVLISRRIKTGFTDPQGQPVEPKITLEGTGSGFGWNAGILLMPSESFSIGLAYRSSTKLTFDGKASFSDVPQSFSTLFTNGGGKSSFTGPATFQIGGAYRVTELLTLELDYQWTGWSTFDSLKVSLEKPINGISEIASPRIYQDAFMIRLGAEYVYDESVTIRAGYIFDRNPVPDGYVEPSLPDANRHDLTCGIGWQATPTLRVDAAYMLVLFERRTESESIPEFSFNGTYENRAHLFSISAEVSLGEVF
ncbi:MAG: hypothetical protein A2X67_09150 [Ignavibacteria bacterium GWA2_55_11]|nr:MAG: hypothetical protein A2X67_09150 [Ignavibacteria bacterium GWA2_55_11]OGU47578.1 MAG: hypothetical protein A2X68_05950 [Ignavibacteria bacterium GWC2_56_12]OGU67788.1 MAG: hypothetical protein A3C56_11275 [Ignavibacteria bacterium RIFCSPHIGHO2_02_FULL_56_12]OGU70634.1 MAG: hypothetical protein A3H45_03045 [Ignavibacteria bacterium RIFCSPLOWO2_02_FULL_55_14]OGU73388.1 MAG: hypothetical protein A3G43_04880 [Ignavibacteria bacterium RIFCSPLOWO2_12_FULL_56_21]